MGFKQQLRVLFSMTIAPGRLAVFFLRLLQQLDFGFWCDAESPKSEDSGAHRNAPCVLDHWTSTVGTQHRCCGRRDIARVANVLKHAGQPIAECDQVLPGICGFHWHVASRPFPETTSAVDHQLASDALTLVITLRSGAGDMKRHTIGPKTPVATSGLLRCLVYSHCCDS